MWICDKNLPEIFYNSSLNWCLSSWLRNVYFCLGTNTTTFVHGSMRILATMVSLQPFKKRYEFPSISLNNWDCELLSGKFDNLTYMLQKQEVPSWFSVWLEFLQAVSYLCGKGSYIWKEIRKPQIVIVIPAKKKKRVLMKLWQLCLVMEKNLQQEQKEAFIPIIYYALVVWVMCLSYQKLCYIMLNNSSKWQWYPSVFSLLFWHL